MRSADDAERYRNRKGFISTNVLVLCDDWLIVRFAYVGVEGSAADGKVLSFSEFLSKYCSLLSLLCFFLGDAGYALSDYCLVPFRGGYATT